MTLKIAYQFPCDIVPAGMPFKPILEQDFFQILTSNFPMKGMNQEAFISNYVNLRFPEAQTHSFCGMGYTMTMRVHIHRELQN